MSNYLEGQIRAHMFRTATLSKPTVMATALMTSATADADTGATAGEVTDANAYARQDLAPLDANWTAPDTTGGLTDNASAITFPTCTTATWGTVSHIRMVDSITHGAGNCFLHGALTASKAVGVGDIFKFNIGDLDVTFARNRIRARLNTIPGEGITAWRRGPTLSCSGRQSNDTAPATRFRL